MMKQVILRLINVVAIIALICLTVDDLKQHKTPHIPKIVTHFDTVEVTPAWLVDSERAWKKKKYTTDTVNIVLTNTIIKHDSIYLGPDTSLRSHLYPLLEYHGGVRFGDTATVVTFSLRDGVKSTSRIFVPGILTEIEADTSATPRLNYTALPEAPRLSLIYRLKLILYGAGAVTIIRGF